jgi:hypothetical protein
MRKYVWCVCTDIFILNLLLLLPPYFLFFRFLLLFFSFLFCFCFFSLSFSSTCYNYFIFLPFPGILFVLFLILSFLRPPFSSHLFSSDGPGIIDAGAWFGCHGNVFTCRCLAMGVLPGSVNQAFSRHVTVLAAAPRRQLHDPPEGRGSHFEKYWSRLLTLLTYVCTWANMLNTISCFWKYFMTQSINILT